MLDMVSVSFMAEMAKLRSAGPRPACKKVFWKNEASLLARTHPRQQSKLGMLLQDPVGIKVLSFLRGSFECQWLRLTSHCQTSSRSTVILAGDNHLTGNDHFDNAT